MKKTCARGGGLLAAIAFAATAWAAEPAASGDASAAPPASPAASSSAMKGITANKNSRLHKCDPMTGDEKKACQADAATHARAAKNKVMAHDAAPTK